MLGQTRLGVPVSHVLGDNIAILALEHNLGIHVC